MKKKIVAAMMTSVMCLSLLAGCGDSGSGQPAAGGNSSSSSSSSTPSSDSQSSTGGSSESTPSGSEADAAGGTDEFEQTWPDGQEIVWLVRDDGATADYSRYLDLITLKEIEEKFHVKFKFEFINGKAEDANQQYLTRLTTSPLPDVIGYLNEENYKEKGGITGLYNDGVCIRLNDLIETKIPNLAKIFEENPDIARDLSNSDGDYLYFERINPYASERDYISSTTTGLIMRQDWLDAVGMEVPTNMQEWYDVLTAFKTMDPNGNGEQDEIPFDAYSSGIMLLEGAFGMTSGIYIDPETGKVEHGARTQKYRAYLEEMNKWYVEGLMGNAFDENGGATKSDAGDDNVKRGIAGSWKGLSNNNTKFGDVMRETQPTAELVAVPWPATTDGKVYSPRTVSRKQRETEIISTDCANDPAKLDAVAAVINYMYSEEGSLMMTWGKEGDSYQVDEYGVRSLTEKGNEQVELQDGSKPQYYKMYGNQSACMPSFGNFDVDSATRDEWYNASATVWASASFELGYPGSISLNAEQSAKVNAGDSQLDTYIAEMKWKFITGQEPLSNFDTYVSNLERMGLSDRIAVYQEAYDAYMAK